MKIAVQTVPTLWTVAFRLLIALAILYSYMRIKNLEFPRESIFWKHCFLLGVTANIIPFSLITWAEKEINSNIASMYMATIPIFSITLAHFLLNDEKISTRISIGTLISISGTVFLLKDSIADMSTGFLSQMACIIVAFFYAFSRIQTKKISETNPVITSTGILICAVFTIFPIALLDTSILDNTPSFR